MTTEQLPQARPKNGSVILTSEEAYRLMELKALEGIEEKFWHRLRRIGLYLSLPILLTTFFGFKSLSDWIKTTIDERVKLEVSGRLAKLTEEVEKTVDAQRAKLDGQIEKTMEAGIFARAATDETRRALHELKTEARLSETAVAQLRNDANSTLKELDGRFSSQRQELQKLNSFVKSYYEGRRTEKFKLKQTPDLLTIPINQKQTMVVIRLAKIPIANSLTLQYHLYAQPPDSYFVARDNVVAFIWADPVERLERQFLYATYAVNPEAGEGFKSVTVKDNRIYADEKELFGLPGSGG